MLDAISSMIIKLKDSNCLDWKLLPPAVARMIPQWTVSTHTLMPTSALKHSRKSSVERQEPVLALHIFSHVL